MTTSESDVEQDRLPEEVAPVGGVRRIAALVVLVLVAVSVALSFALVPIVLPQISEYFGTLQTGWAVTVLSLVGAIATPIAGKLGDIFGKRLVLTLLIVVAVAGSVLTAIATDYAVFLVGRGLQGLLLAAVPLAYSLMRDVFSPSWFTMGACSPPAWAPSVWSPRRSVGCSSGVRARRGLLVPRGARRGLARGCAPDRSLVAAALAQRVGVTGALCSRWRWPRCWSLAGATRPEQQGVAAGVVSPGQSGGGALGAQLVVLLLSGLVRVGDSTSTGSAATWWH
ncbi:MFS transporter [Pseudonocardia lutea]|uniref:MFS transporter n=1 Tax=Pseudonocardia lutea TaxID=2172015 RepID=A0ABW1I9T6_9PSEU